MIGTGRSRRQRGWTAWRALRVLLVILGYGFVVGPVLPVFYQAFNSASVYPSPFEGFTLEWFRALGDYREFIDGAWVSLKVGLAATSLALVIGVSASFAVVRGPHWMRGASVTSILMGPIVVPQIVIGLAILRLANENAIDVGLRGLVVAHAVFVAPFIIRMVAASLEAQGGSFEQTAMVLGARPNRVLRTVTLPMLRPTLIASSVFAFTLSFVNVPLSLFLAPSDQRPLPISVYQYMSSNRSPLLAALSVALAVVLLAMAGAVEKILRVRLLQ